MYYEYWNLEKPPFDNVPDPTMYVESHESVENCIAETLFAIEEGNECIAVIVGNVGLGKTLSLRIILDSLTQDKYKVAFVTNPDMSFVQLLREIVGQLTGVQCEIRGKVSLLEMFNKLLFDTADEEKKVLIFIDEANALTPSNLESLRLLTNMQDDSRNLFTIVLAGQLELARRLEHPKRANLFQRVGTYSKLERIKSEELARTYVEARLKLAGGTRPIFTDEAFHAIWEYSEHGVPRLINKICKLCLKAGETNGFNVVDGEMVKQIGERFQKMTGPAVPKRRPRKQRPEALRQLDDDDQDLLVEAVPVSPVLAEPQPVVSSEAERLDPAATTEAVRPAVAATPSMDEEVDINGVKFTVRISPETFEEALTSSGVDRDRLAGMLAAQTLERNPGLTSALSRDPVAIWGEIRDCILARFGQQKEAC